MAQEHPDGTAQALDALYQCFRAGTHAATGGGRTVDFGPGTEAFFFEQLGAAMQVLGNTPNISWCEPWFVEPYVKAHAALHGAAVAPGAAPGAPAHSPRMPLSTGVHLGKEDRLIHLASRMGGVSHVSAHADMVRHALAAPAVARELRRLRLNTCERGVIMQGAQVPDLYLFDSPLWHAQSEPNGAPEASRRRFVALVANTLAQARAAAVAQDPLRAMLLLGAASHAVQDLYYHRGMTQGQKAGLTYVAHSNPDLPGELLAQQQGLQATQATSALLAAALAPWPQEIGAHADAAEGGAYVHDDLMPLIESLWPGAQATSYDTLRRYFALSDAYRGSAQLTQAQDLARANRGLWAPDATLRDIMGAL